MDAQQTFEKVARHLLTQNAKATDADENCLYRDIYTGRSCAVGCLIPEEDYTVDFEYQLLYLGDESKKRSTNIGDYLVKHGYAEHFDLLNALQKIHDYSDIYKWKYELIECGHQYNLNVDFIGREFP